MPKKQKIALRTVLIVVEGYTDKAFADHLKSLYVTRGCGVSVRVRNAKGKGADNVVGTALGVREGFDRVVCLFDADLPLKKTLRDKARCQRFALVATSPCIEGLFLDILEKPVPDTCHECKQRFSPIIGTADFKDAASYAPVFTKEILENRRTAIPALNKLLGMLE